MTALVTVLLGGLSLFNGLFSSIDLEDLHEEATHFSLLACTLQSGLLVLALGGGIGGLISNLI